VPVPSHVWATLLVVVSAQMDARQTAPGGYSLHLRPPSHTPLRLHDAAPSSGHSPSGSVPSGTAVQTPTLPARLHFSHVPPHRALQQTPSAQKPLKHSPSPPQAKPSFFLHTPDAVSQELPAVQSELDVQAALHAAETHE
jgi:hypothetical protein